MLKDLLILWIFISGCIGFSAGVLSALLIANRTISESLTFDGIVAVIIIWFGSLYVTWEVKH